VTATLPSWLRLDCHYAEDPAVLALSDLARLAWLDGLCLAKRTHARGVIHRAQVRLVVPQSAEDRSTIIDELTRAGLWLEVDDGWEIRSWERWNGSGSGDQRRTANAHRTNHLRGRHAPEKLGPNPDCPLCITQMSLATGSDNGATSQRQESDPSTPSESATETPGDVANVASDVASDLSRQDRDETDVINPPNPPSDDGGDPPILRNGLRANGTNPRAIAGAARAIDDADRIAQDHQRSILAFGDKWAGTSLSHDEVRELAVNHFAGPDLDQVMAAFHDARTKVGAP